jgi:hypothetical protein
MTYLQLVEKLSNLTPEQLSHSVILYDSRNDYCPEAVTIFKLTEPEDDIDKNCKSIDIELGEGLLPENQFIIGF